MKVKITCPRCGIQYMDNTPWKEEQHMLCYSFSGNGCWEKFTVYCENNSSGVDEATAYREFMGFAHWVKRVRSAR